MRISTEELNLFPEGALFTGGSQTVSIRIYKILRDKILTMQLLPDTATSEQEIASMLQVSRTPVREAFIRLSREKLLMVSPQRRTTVAKISIEHVEQERFLRESLEQAVLEQFILNTSPAALLQMENNLQKQREMLELQNPIKFLHYDDAFHEVFYQATGHMLCHQILKRSCFDYERLRHLSCMSHRNIQKENLKQHEAIFQFIQERRLADALTALREHLRHLFDEIKEMRNENPDYFQ